jgi:Flp pilus assembly secretin CpaC
MSVAFEPSRSGCLVAAVALTLIATFAAAPAATETLTVAVDQATVAKLPERVATIVIGNPLIADVSLQSGGLMVITGKGYGVTNVVALDRSGAVLMEKAVQVQGPRDELVVVYRGIERESYTCTPKCERRITLGDSAAFFDATISQSGSRNGQAVGSAQPPR